jgi:hypothetical protein
VGARGADVNNEFAKTCKSRGGKRPGAGRPEILTKKVKLDVGGWCEDQWRQAQLAALKEQIDGDQRLVDYRQTVRRAHLTPVRDRARWLDEHLPQHEADVAEDLRDALGSDNYNAPPRRIIRYAQPRLKGIRDKIINDAIEHFKPTCPGITSRAVKAAWTRFRKFEMGVRRSLTDAV